MWKKWWRGCEFERYLRRLAFFNWYSHCLKTRAEVEPPLVVWPWHFINKLVEETNIVGMSWGEVLIDVCFVFYFSFLKSVPFSFLMIDGDFFHSLPMREEHNLWLQHLHGGVQGVQGATDDEDDDDDDIVEKIFERHLMRILIRAWTTWHFSFDFWREFQSEIGQHNITNRSSKFDFSGKFQSEIVIFFSFGEGFTFPTLGIIYIYTLTYYIFSLPHSSWPDRRDNRTAVCGEAMLELRRKWKEKKKEKEKKGVLMGERHAHGGKPHSTPREAKWDGGTCVFLFYFFVSKKLLGKKNFLLLIHPLIFLSYGEDLIAGSLILSMYFLLTSTNPLSGHIGAVGEDLLIKGIPSGCFFHCQFR